MSRSESTPTIFRPSWTTRWRIFARRIRSRAICADALGEIVSTLVRMMSRSLTTHLLPTIPDREASRNRAVGSADSPGARQKNCSSRFGRSPDAKESFSPSALSYFMALIWRSRRCAVSDVLKVIEVLAESEKGWEDAAREAVEKAAKTLTNIRSIYIENFEAKVEKNKISRYRVNAKISFLLE